jgi:hypothetical protein
MTLAKFGFRIALVFLCGLAVLQYLNFTGFCYGAGRYLSDQELLDLAIESKLARQSVGNPETNRLYKSVEEFRSQNPQCCELVRTGHEIIDSIISRLFGFYVSVARLHYKANESPEIDNYYAADISMSACGRVLKSQGMPTKR